MNNAENERQGVWFDHPFQLRTVRLREISGKSIAPRDQEDEVPDLKILVEMDDERNTDDGFFVAVLFEAERAAVPGSVSGSLRRFSLNVVLEGYFEKTVDVSVINPKDIERFKRCDAAMILWPYLRETVHSITERMQLGMPPLPVVSWERLALTSEEEE